MTCLRLRTSSCAHRSRYRQGLLGREGVATLQRRMPAAATDAFDLIATGVGDLASER
jgi:hypothetical protein